jgi:hypothetical protein
MQAFHPWRLARLKHVSRASRPRTTSTGHLATRPGESPRRRVCPRTTAVLAAASGCPLKSTKPDMRPARRSAPLPMAPATIFTTGQRSRWDRTRANGRRVRLRARVNESARRCTPRYSMVVDEFRLFYEDDEFAFFLTIGHGSRCCICFQCCVAGPSICFVVPMIDYCSYVFPNLNHKDCPVVCTYSRDGLRPNPVRLWNTARSNEPDRAGRD